MNKIIFNNGTIYAKKKEKTPLTIKDLEDVLSLYTPQTVIGHFEYDHDKAVLHKIEPVTHITAEMNSNLLSIVIGSVHI